MYKTQIHPSVKELSLRPQPEQKSDAWHAARRAALTASDVASALPRDECSLREYIAEFGQWLKEEIKFSSKASMNPYETTKNLVMKKLGQGKPFLGNTATAWGNQFEKVAQLTYEKMHQVDLLEFGLLFDQENSWVAASPDGIRADGKCLLEIKCPLMREIGSPPPHYYWTQMLWQMQTCKIERTHFMDCCINHYATKRTWLKEMEDDIAGGTSVWNVDNAHHVQSRETAFPCGEGRTFKYGAIVEVKKYDNAEQLIDMTYVYPDEIHDTLEEIDEWTNDVVKSVTTDHTTVARVIYYKMEKVVIFTVPRSTVWFERNKTRLLRLWNSILAERANMQFSDISTLTEKVLAAR